jgi:hypoxanthine phosphoribosyltransferase
MDLYIELTTARQRLISHKRRKVRRLRELYPEINIKLINRKDFIKMLHKYDMDDEADDLIGTI